MSNSELDLFERIADEYSQRCRQGEAPSVEEYAVRYPELADRIRRLLPALDMMEQHAADADSEASNSTAEGETADEAPPPERIGDFRILRELGRGGMGIVYEAEQESLGRRVALKVLTETSRLDPRRQRRFREEARSAARLHHTNIVPVFGVGQHGDVSYLVMQYISGEGLDRVLQSIAEHGPSDTIERSTNAKAGRSTDDAAPDARREAPATAPETAPVATADTTKIKLPSQTAPMRETVTLPGMKQDLSRFGTEEAYWRSVARIGIQVADALDEAHRGGVMHRDIKPSNLLLDEKGSVWISDFGLAKLEQTSDMTRTGEVVGTLRYMSPEQLKGESDTRTDIYSFGLTLYEMLALSPAFDERDQAKMIERISRGDIPRLRRKAPRVPRDLEAIVTRCTQASIDKRYATAGQIRDDLESYLAGRPISARRVYVWDHLGKWVRRHPAVSFLLLMLLIVTAVGVTGITVNWRQAESNFEESERQRLRRDRYFNKALESVDAMLTRVGDESLANVPGMSKVRGELLLEAVAFYEEFLGDEDDSPLVRQETARAHARLAKLQHLLRDNAKAEYHYREAMTQLDGLADEVDDRDTWRREYSYVVAEWGKLLENQGKYDEAEFELRRAIDILEVDAEVSPEQIANEDRALLADHLHSIGLIQMRSESMKKAISTMRSAVDFFDSVEGKLADKGDFRQKHSMCVESLAILLEPTAQRAESGPLYDRATEIRESLVADYPAERRFRNDLTASLAATARRQFMAGKASDGLTTMQRTVDVQRELCKEFPSIPNYRFRLVGILQDYGVMLDMQNQSEKSEQVLVEGHELCQRLCDDYPDSPMYSKMLADCCNRLGVYYARRQMPEKTIPYYIEATDTWRAAWRDNPSDEQSLFRLTVSLSNLAHAIRDSGDLDEAEEIYAETITLQESLCEASPENSEYQHKLAISKSSLALLLIKRNALDQARELADEVIESYQSLVELHPEDARYQQRSAYAFDTLAKTYPDDYDAQLAALQQATSRFEALVAAAPERVSLQIDYTKSLHRIARLKIQHGHLQEGREGFEKSLKIRQQLFEASKDDSQLASLLASVHGHLGRYHVLWIDRDEMDRVKAGEHIEHAIELDPAAIGPQWTRAYLDWCDESFQDCWDKLDAMNADDDPLVVRLQIAALDQLNRHAERDERQAVLDQLLPQSDDRWEFDLLERRLALSE